MVPLRSTAVFGVIRVVLKIDPRKKKERDLQ